jgi:glycosyltransferase involved in cell wall biosynthesis
MAHERVGVVVPTRNRPEHLRRCLEALAQTREHLPFRAWVCDSSAADQRPEIQRICARHPWVELRFHEGSNVSAARNLCARVAEAELLVSVDDDVVVEPQAVTALVDAYDRGSGARVVAGAVVWGPAEEALAPMIIRRIGYGRAVRSGESAAFLNSSLFLYPRAYALQWPWNERMRRASDVLMGAIWGHAGVAIGWAPEARAHHEERDAITLEQHDDYVYALLAHMLVAAKRPVRLAMLETGGLAAGVKGYARSPQTLAAYLRAWTRGHAAFMRDYRRLRELAARPVPPVSSHAGEPRPAIA